MRRFRLALVSLLLLTPQLASAQQQTNVRKLSYDVRIDGAVTLTGFVWYAASEALKIKLVPSKCRWCYRHADGTSGLNVMDRGIRNRLVWKNTAAAATLSNVIAFGTLPAMALGFTNLAALVDHNKEYAPVDALLVAEASMLALDLNQFVKYAFARERPFVHFLPRAPEGVRQLTASPSDDNLSFFSGHTTGAFAVATSAGTVASLRGYRLTPLVWATGMLSAVAVGYLRIAADKHYFSDVLVAAVVGSAIGAGIPLLFHGPTDTAPPTATARASLTSSPPPMLSFGGAW